VGWSWASGRLSASSVTSRRRSWRCHRWACWISTRTRRLWIVLEVWREDVTDVDRVAGDEVAEAGEPKVLVVEASALPQRNNNVVSLSSCISTRSDSGALGQDDPKGADRLHEKLHHKEQIHVHGTEWYSTHVCTLSLPFRSSSSSQDNMVVGMWPRSSAPPPAANSSSRWIDDHSSMLPGQRGMWPWKETRLQCAASCIVV
jgi:hypothetical protein